MTIVTSLTAREVMLATRSPASLDAAAIAAHPPLAGRARFYPSPGGRAAMVICPGLAGPLEGREYGYAERLAAAGHATLVFDPYATRSAAWLPDVLRALCVGPGMMLADAFAALDFLRDRGHDRVGVMGFSYGAMVALLAAHAQVANVFAPGGARFAGHVGYYGPTIPRFEHPGTTGAPVLMLMGARDRNLNIPRARLIAEDLRRGGSPVELRVLDAEHAWDGEDHVRRHVLFSLRDCAVRIGPDGVLRSDRSGGVVRGRVGLALHMIRHARIAGYHMHRNAALAAVTDALLLRFLDGISAPIACAA